MSNVMLGGTRPDGRSWAFYETNGCGMGARPQRDGIDAIHVHMTNTLNTPIEAIEREFPLRVTRYEIAEGTGGAAAIVAATGCSVPSNCSRVRATPRCLPTGTRKALRARRAADPEAADGTPYAAAVPKRNFQQR